MSFINENSDIFPVETRETEHMRKVGGMFTTLEIGVKQVSAWECPSCSRLFKTKEKMTKHYVEHAMGMSMQGIPVYVKLRFI